MLDPLLELPAVGVRLAAIDAFELRLRRLELLARPFVVDLAGEHGVVDERDRPVELNLEEPRSGRVLVHLPVALDVDARRAGSQGCDQRGVPREAADAGGAAGPAAQLRL